jgi:hypothetical protein
MRGRLGQVAYCNTLYGLDRGFTRYEDAYENQTASLVRDRLELRPGKAGNSGPRLSDLVQRRGHVGPENGGDDQSRRPRLARGRTLCSAVLHVYQLL